MKLYFLTTEKSGEEQRNHRENGEEQRNIHEYCVSAFDNENLPIYLVGAFLRSPKVADSSFSCKK
jgi:hypothetical protein